MTNKEQLIEQKKKIEGDIDRLKKIIDASNDTTFEIIIEDLKEQMIGNVNAEDWAQLKSNLKDVSSINGTRDFIESQSILLAKKQTELEELTNQIDHYQTSLFEQQNSDEKIETGIKFKTIELCTGDVYKSNIPNVTNGYWYFLIKKSSEKDNNFCIVSNFFPNEEKLLQYPKNIECLENTFYIGNIFENDDDAAKAKEALKKIYEKKDEKDKG